MPAYNAGKYIRESLDSVLGQTYANLEIIVVDDGSTDDTAEIVKQYRPRVQYHRQLNSGGSAVPRNTGLEHSTGAYLSFLDADDLMVPERIAFQVGFMERHRDVGLTFCNYRNFGESDSYPLSHFQTCPQLSALLGGREEVIVDRACPYLADENFGITGAFMIRRELLELEPGFETKLRSCEDFHFYYRLARHTRVGIIDRVGLLRRCHSSNKSGDPLRMYREGIHSRTLLRATERDPVAAKYLDKYIADRHSHLARHHANRREYADALKEQRLALLADPDLPRMLSCCKGVARTFSIALGLHKPVE